MARKKSTGPTVTGDAAQAWNLVLLARSVGLAVDHVSVGACSMNLRQAPNATPPLPDAEPDPRPQFYADFGGELYRQMMGDKQAGAVVPGMELQPSIEVGE